MVLLKIREGRLFRVACGDVKIFQGVKGQMGSCYTSGGGLVWPVLARLPVLSQKQFPIRFALLMLSNTRECNI